MGEAFDRTGQFLGDAMGASMRDVAEKLERAHPDVAEMRIRHLESQMAQMEMPRYKCHKEVHALKIVAVQSDSADASAEGRETDGSARLLVEAPYSGIKVSGAWLRKHTPEVGGYYVVYEDGYTSYSPAAAFEGGYTKL